MAKARKDSRDMLYEPAKVKEKTDVIPIPIVWMENVA